MTGNGFTRARAAAMVAAALFFAGWVAPACAADVALCAACHGPQGNSSIPAIPSLAGQPKQFITTQLIMFRLGNRKDPQMSPIAAGLTDAQIDEFGTYFSAQAPVAAGTAVDPERLVEARRLAEAYNCVQCHGPQLKGQQHIPRLAGQQAVYLATQLRGFKASTRFDMDGTMTSAAQVLPEKDIDTLAPYLSGLR